MKQKTLLKKASLILLVFVIICFSFNDGNAQILAHANHDPGFWKGLLHGFLLLFRFIGSWFWDINVYASPNAGFWYDLGFLFGVMTFFGGGGAGAKKKRC